jgi:hypothetical protein
VKPLMQGTWARVVEVPVWPSASVPESAWREICRAEGPHPAQWNAYAWIQSFQGTSIKVDIRAYFGSGLANWYEQVRITTNNQYSFLYGVGRPAQSVCIQARVISETAQPPVKVAASLAPTFASWW